MPKVSRDQSKQTAHRKANYKRFEVYVRRGTLLEALLLRYKKRNPNERSWVVASERTGGISELVRDCLFERFGISDWEMYAPETENSQGEVFPASHDLDKILDASDKP